MKTHGKRRVRLRQVLDMDGQPEREAEVVHAAVQEHPRLPLVPDACDLDEVPKKGGRARPGALGRLDRIHGVRSSR